MSEWCRCAFLHLEPVEKHVLDPLRLLAGESGLVPVVEWHAWAAHLDESVALDAAEVEALGRVSPSVWVTSAELEAEIGVARAESLCRKRLLVARDGTDVAALPRLASNDAYERAGLHWHAGSAIAHAASRWSGKTQLPATAETVSEAVALMVERCGPPPPHFHRRGDAVARVPLDEPVRTPLDELLERRATCRNFDLTQPVSTARLSALLKRVFGVQGMEELAPGAVALKKNHPSGGGLHPVEAYLIVQRVEGLATGLYHYSVEAHALDLLRGLPSGDVRAFAKTAVAGQDYFADAPVLLVMAARFARSMWKYRNHAKIYRAILLEMGHISQNLYLTATEMSLGAFITAAINEVEIEQAFGLEPLAEGPMCVCGFGARGKERVTVEFDPAHKVWSGP